LAFMVWLRSASYPSGQSSRLAVLAKKRGDLLAAADVKLPLRVAVPPLPGGAPPILVKGQL